MWLLLKPMLMMKTVLKAKKQLRWLAVVSAMVVLSGCASERNYALAVHSWIGQPATRLMPIWGYPNKIMPLPHGHKLYVYRSHQHVQNPVTTIPGYTSVDSYKGHTTIYSSPPVITGGGSYNLRCNTWFEINKHAVIVNARYRGNNCVATHQFVQGYSAGGLKK